MQDQPVNPQTQQGIANGSVGPASPAAEKSNSPVEQPMSTLAVSASSLDELVSGAARDADDAAKSKSSDHKPIPGQEEKKTKKEKDKNMKLVYSDNEVSPEEKMAQLPRYAFARAG